MYVCGLKSFYFFADKIESSTAACIIPASLSCGISENDLSKKLVQTARNIKVKVRKVWNHLYSPCFILIIAVKCFKHAYITSIAHLHAMFSSSWIIWLTSKPVSVLKLWSITPKPDIILKNMNIVISTSFILNVNSGRQCLNMECEAATGAVQSSLYKMRKSTSNISDKSQQYLNKQFN